MEEEVRAGLCSACGRQLVRVGGQDPYHPAAVMQEGELCPDLLMIPGTSFKSFKVPADHFVVEAVLADG